VTKGRNLVARKVKRQEKPAFDKKREEKSFFKMMPYLVGFLLAAFSGAGGVTISQEQACYFEPYMKQLSCECGPTQEQVYLSLRLGYWVREVGHEVGPLFLIWSSHLTTSIPHICQFLGNTTLFRPVKGSPKSA